MRLWRNVPSGLKHMRPVALVATFALLVSFLAGNVLSSFGPLQEKPLTEKQIFDVLAERNEPIGDRNRTLILAINKHKRGVNFTLTPEIGERLVRAGATPKLIQVIRANYRKPPVTPPSPVPTPVVKDKITELSKEFIEDLGNSTGLDMVRVEGGSFKMGTPDNEIKRNIEERPQHDVTVKTFYLGKYEVTQAQWSGLMGTNPSESGFRKEKFPVHNVSWEDAKKFCERLSKKTGKKYRLPSEAEWEYAARAGTKGDYAGNLNSMAWYNLTADYSMHGVGEKDPNAWGLYDMHGNVGEWCEDEYHNDYIGAPKDGSAWTGEAFGLSPDRPEALSRVIRGGSYASGSYNCRSAARGYLIRNENGMLIGFRVVMEVPVQS